MIVNNAISEIVRYNNVLLINKHLFPIITGVNTSVVSKWIYLIYMVVITDISKYISSPCSLGRHMKCLRSNPLSLHQNQMYVYRKMKFATNSGVGLNISKRVIERYVT